MKHYLNQWQETIMRHGSWVIKQNERQKRELQDL